MPRSKLAGVALTAILIGCRDAPTTFEMPVESQIAAEVKSTVQASALLTIRLTLDDPLVLGMVEELGDRTVAYGFDDIRYELDRLAFERNMPAVHRALMTTRDLVVGDSAATDVVLRDVLQLVLDDVAAMLAGAAYGPITIDVR